MCLIAFRYNKKSDYPFVFVENRDEKYTRPSSSIHFWEDEPSLLAGKDLKRGGTWLGITKSKQIAALLNHPFTGFEPDSEVETLSRGNLVRRFLTEESLTEHFLGELKETRHLYDGYHLFFGSLDNLHMYSNALDRDIKFKKGIHSITNTQDDLSQFKLKRSNKLLSSYLKNNKSPDVDELTTLFKDTQTNKNISNFPETISRKEAIQNTSIFIEGEEFGSVGTTAIIVDKHGKVDVKEIRYNNNQHIIEETFHSFQFDN